MKRIVAVLMLVMLVLLLAMPGAYAEAVDKTEVGTQVVSWVLCGILSALGALATWAVKSYVVPWIRDSAVPWLRQHQLLEAAKVAVEYAEAIVGRCNGEEKLQLALTVMESKGWIKSDEVLQAIKAKWQELNLAQIAAGIKSALVSGEGNASI